MYLIKIKNIEKQNLTYIWNVKTNKQAHRHRKQIGGCQRQGVGV